MKPRQALALPVVLSILSTPVGPAFAQYAIQTPAVQAPPQPMASPAPPVASPAAPVDNKDFDPVTRALSDKNPTIPAEVQAGNPPLTPEQQAEAARQKQLADIQAKKAESRKKYLDAEKVRKDREDAAKAAEQQRIATVKAAREARAAEIKQDREQLAALKEEEVTARKAYQDAKKNATGDAVRQIETDYEKAEKDRQAKIKELRHPKYKPLKSYEPGQTGQAGQNGTTALPGTVTSGSGPTVTQH